MREVILPSTRCAGTLTAARVCTAAAWIEQRLEDVYKQDPRYSDKAQSLFNLDLGAPEVCGVEAR